MKASEAGFTYLWVLLVVAFLGVGLVAATEVQTTLSRRSQEQALLSIGHQYRNAIARYHGAMRINGRNEYPATLDDLLQDKRFPEIRRHLRRIYPDPLTGKVEWGLTTVAGRIVGVHSLSEATPIKQDGFEAQDGSLRNKSKYSEWVFSYPPDLVVNPESAAGAASAPSWSASGVLQPLFPAPGARK
jgi:type II secretory pathway pseudopilin PulG